MEEKASKEFDCDNCSEKLQKKRNCNNQYPPSDDKRGFLFPIGTIRNEREKKEKTINECPTSYINEFSRAIWSKYMDCKVKKELGIMIDIHEIKRLHFEAFQIFMEVEGEHFRMESDKNKPKEGKKGI